MKRNMKNGITILLIFLTIGGIILTINIAKNNSTNENPGGMGTPPTNNQTNMPEPPSQNQNNNETTNQSNDTPENKNQSNNQQPPEKPDGEDNNAPSGMPNNQMENNQPTSNQDIALVYYFSFILEGAVLASLIMYLVMSNFNKKTLKETFSTKEKIVIDALSIIILTSGITYVSTKMINPSQNKMKMNQDSNNVSYSATKEINENSTITSGDYTSTNKDENALLISGSTTEISNITVNKTGDSDGGDSTSFYGNNSAILAKDGANLTLSNIIVTTDATGANGVFSYGGSVTTNNSSSDGTSITISDSSITTIKDNSGGIMTTGGGIMNASNLTIQTAGTSSAAIRTDRGGGTVNVDGGTYTTTGQGSPTIYSTANITVKNAKLVSKASEGIVIEGKNSVTIENSTLIDSNTKLNRQSTTYKNIFLYQSMSGDAADGSATFTAKNSSITTNNGDTFYVTNTKANINLENNFITNNDSSGNLLRIQKDSWGNTGSNGGEVTFNMTNQTAIGNIVVDSISTLEMNLSKSYYEGTINGDNSAKEISLKLSKDSTIKLTGDSYITSLEDEDTSYSNIDFNGYKLYVNGTSIN